MRDTPVVRCQKIGRGTTLRWRFWCKHCRAWHTHSPEPGFRVAHCYTRAGRDAYRNGYILELETK